MRFRFYAYVNKAIIFNFYMEVGMAPSNPKPPFKAIFFNFENKIIIALLFSILWYRNDEEVDESILGFLSQF